MSWFNYFILGIITFVLSGCATRSTPNAPMEAPVSQVEQVKAQITAQLPSAKEYKRKVAIAMFSNESNYGRSLMTDQDYGDYSPPPMEDHVMQKKKKRRKVLIILAIVFGSLLAIAGIVIGIIYAIGFTLASICENTCEAACQQSCENACSSDMIAFADIGDAGLDLQSFAKYTWYVLTDWFNNLF